MSRRAVPCSLFLVPAREGVTVKKDVLFSQVYHTVPSFWAKILYEYCMLYCTSTVRYLGRAQTKVMISHLIFFFLFMAAEQKYYCTVQYCIRRAL